MASLFDLAQDHHRAGRLADAEALYRRAIAADPRQGAIWLHLVALLEQVGRMDDALAAAQHGRAAAGESAELDYAVGALRQQLGRMAESIAPLERAVALRAGYAHALTNLGNAYRAVGRVEEAETMLRQAVAAAPDLPEAWFNLGVVMQVMGRWEEARAAYDAAVALRGDFAQAHVNRAVLRMLLADWGGLDEYEWRMAYYGMRTPAGFAPWRGEDLRGRSILIDMEQGYGDAIQFCRYAPLLAERGARVTVRVDHALAELMRTLDGVEVMGRDDWPQRRDLHVWMMSLARLCGGIVTRVPYLRGKREGRWEGRLRAEKSMRVGVCWTASALNPDTAAKSIPAVLLEPLSRVEGARFYSLQKRAELAAPGWMVDWTAELRDFADTAALVEQLDLVISVDTAVAHLAGAMGKRVWTLLPFSPDWRWMLEREESPWYPTMRLFRQPVRGDWRTVIERVCVELANDPAAKH